MVVRLPEFVGDASDRPIPTTQYCQYRPARGAVGEACRVVDRGLNLAYAKTFDEFKQPFAVDFRCDASGSGGFECNFEFVN